MLGWEHVRMGGWQTGKDEDGRAEGWDGMREGLSSCRAPEDVRRGGMTVWEDVRMGRCEDGRMANGERRR
jgi:hypothetical protein